MISDLYVQINNYSFGLVINWLMCALISAAISMFWHISRRKEIHNIPKWKLKNTSQIFWQRHILDFYVHSKICQIQAMFQILQRIWHCQSQKSLVLVGKKTMTFQSFLVSGSQFDSPFWEGYWRPFLPKTLFLAVLGDGGEKMLCWNT